MADNDILDTVEELRLLADAMGDPELEETLVLVIKAFRKPDVPVSKAPELIVKVQALATKFAFAATYYKTFGKDGTQERYRKDVYYTASDSLDKLADAIKYIAKGQNRW